MLLTHFFRFFVPALLVWLPIFARGYRNDRDARRSLWLGAWVTTSLATVVILTTASQIDDIVGMA